MSLHNSTKLKTEIGSIVDSMLKNEEHPNTEVLIYFNDEEEWTIIKDRRFFSYGLTVEDKVSHLEKMVEMCYRQMLRINEMSNVGNIKGIVKDVAWELKDGMNKYKNNKIERSN
ncbi:hypothetical protein [Paenibacillus dendritiformis]|uniref:hypothetical protein n=1 Tax=Paenibacillus dendritiformis TaxID=130049 RepID=UPI00387E0416